MHDVIGLISKFEVLQAETVGLLHAVVCPLTQGFGLLPITDGLANELRLIISDEMNTPNSPISELSKEIHAFALRVFPLAPVAFICTEYYGGAGGQVALTWRQGFLWFKPRIREYRDRSWPNSSISQALRNIGVSALDDKDEFDTLCLGSHRSTSSWAKAYAESGLREGLG